MKKPSKRKRINELTPEVLTELDQSTLIGLVMKLYEQNKELSEQLQAFMQEKYGRKTEKHESPDQLRIFGAESNSESEKSSEHTEQTSKNQRQPKPGHGRNPMPSHLTKEKIQRQPRHHERVCKCGNHRVKVNEVVRNRRLECVPVNFYIEEIIDSVWECPSCHDTVVVAAEPFEPIPNGTAGPRLLVKIAEDRWLKHLPLYRQEQIFARLGVDINRSTMCGWMAALAAILLPLYLCMKEELLKSKIIATDDTPVKVQDRSKKSNIKRTHEWIFMGDKEHPVNLFHHTQGRSRAGPKKFIPGFTGYLQGDCFSGNRALCAETGATLVACRAHDRRYYKKARPNNKRLCDQMLDMYSQLFEIEQAARDLQLTSDQIVAIRKEEAVPLLEKMKAWLDEHALTTLPSSSFGKAITYSLNNWEVLNNYLLDGNLRINNNLAEQQMKMFATGRKSWYFFGSDEAGEQASIMLSIFSTCLRNAVEPGAYLLDVLKRLSNEPACDLQELLPHNWQPITPDAEIATSEPTPKMPSSV